MKKELKGLIWISTHILILLAIGLVWIWSIRTQRNEYSNQLEIAIIKPNPENTLITKEAVLAHTKKFFKKDYRKIRQYAIKAKELEDYFEKLQVVHHADIYTDSKNNIHIDIYQRDPLMRIVDNNGNQYYVDKDGYRISTNNYFSARVPVVTGLPVTMQGNYIWDKKNLLYQSVYKVALEISQNSFVSALIEQIDLDPSGEFYLIPKVGMEKINLGGMDKVKEKLEKLSFFYSQGLPYQGWNVYETIDLKNDNQVVCKKYNHET